jgi:molybdopterin-guanine dinucleotide biosynthesis protein A
MPKAQLVLGGVPILEGLMARLAWAGPTLLVTAPGRTRPPGAGAFDREVVDDVADEGPLRGVFTALTVARTEIVVCLTVDMPGVEAAHASWIADALRERPNVLGLMCVRRGAGGEAIEPFPSAFRRSALPAIGAALAGRRRSVHGLLREAGFATVDVPGAGRSGRGRI